MKARVSACALSKSHLHSSLSIAASEPLPTTLHWIGALCFSSNAHAEGRRIWKLSPQCARLLAATIFLLQSASGLHAENLEYLSEPISERALEPYRHLLKDKLLTSPGDYGVMMLMPTGLGEWAVSADIVRQGKKNSPGYRLSLTSATVNLYDSKLSWDRKDADVPVSEITVNIDKQFALAIQRAWRAILSKDAPPQLQEEFAMVLDGYSADFSVKMPDGRVITRRALSPQAPPAREIVTLGYDLRDYCLSPADQRKSKRRDIIDKLDRFNEEIEKKHISRPERGRSRQSAKLSSRKRGNH